jgi:hypothetical protein
MLVRDFSGNTMSHPADFAAGFIASSWHVRSSGQFAGSCIGVILLAMSLESLRRASRNTIVISHFKLNPNSNNLNP